MTDTPLAHPRDVYRAFTIEESELLRGYVASVRRVGRMRFFDQLPSTATQSWDGERLIGEMTEPDDEAAQAAISAFRPLYTSLLDTDTVPSEPTSGARA